MNHQDRANQISDLLGEQLRVRGNTLEKRVRKAGRLLPRKLRHDAQKVIEATEMQANPKLARRVNDRDVTRSYKLLKEHLVDIDAKDRRKGKLINFLAGNAINLMIVFAGFVAVLRWRGFL